MPPKKNYSCSCMGPQKIETHDCEEQIFPLSKALSELGFISMTKKTLGLIFTSWFVANLPAMSISAEI